MAKKMTDYDYVQGITKLILTRGSVTVTDVLNEYQNLYADDVVTYLNNIVGDGIIEDRDNNTWVVDE